MFSFKMTNFTVLKFACKDSMCRSVILIGDLETSVQCLDCGINYDQSALKDAEPFTDYEEMLWKLYRRHCSDRIARRGAESIRINGFSNYYCKLLSPFLTHYGMEKASGNVKLLSEMSQGDILDCSVFKDRAFLVDPEQLAIVGYGRDISGSLSYLSVTLDMIKKANEGEERLVPIYTDGDGHCLVHAISRSLVGRELFWHPLRCCLKKHLEDNLSKYKELFQDFMEAEDWKAIIEESDPDFKPPEGELHGLRNVHIFGLANILKRPIILLDSLECMKKCGDYSALFLPGFIPPEDCRGADNSLNKPICIAWSSFSHNHYIPLVGVKKRPLPVLPKYLIPKVWGMPQSEFDNYMELDNNGNCVIGGDRALQENYMHRLMKAMEGLFTKKKGVHPMLVADAKLYLCSESAYLNVKVETVIENTRLAVEKGSLFHCNFCKAMIKIDLDHSLYGIGGLIYKALYEYYVNITSDGSYRDPDTGIVFKYDAEKNEFTPDMSSFNLQCTCCGSSNVRRLRPDSTPIDLPGEDTFAKPGSSLNQETQKTIFIKMLESKSISGHESMWFLDKILNSKASSSRESLSFMNQFEKTKGNSDMLIIEVNWRDKAIQHLISISEFTKFGNTNGERVSNLASKIATKYYPSESENSELLRCIRDKIYTQVNRMPVDSVISPVTLPAEEKKEEIEDSCVEVPSEAADAAIPEPQCIKVVSSKGQQGNIRLSTEGLSYRELQEWIAVEFNIPFSNQTIKWGFPPKELEVPLHNDERNLPLKHGDRLLVEVKTLPPPQKKNYTNSSVYNNSYNYQGPSEIPLDWSVIKHEPDLFRNGGTVYKKANSKFILKDNDHVSVDGIPAKRFNYNKITDSLELCVKPLGHFTISGDIDERIEKAKQGDTNISGFKRCPQSFLPPKEPAIFRPIRKPIAPSPQDESQAYCRKGPGWTVIAKPEGMDIS